MRLMMILVVAVVFAAVAWVALSGIYELTVSHPEDDTRPTVDCYQRAEDSIEGLMLDRTPSERRASLTYITILLTCRDE